MAKNISRIGYIHKVTKANEDLLSQEVANFDTTFTNPRIKKLSIKVDKDCYFIINGCEIKVLTDLGLVIDYEDFVINEFKIVTPGVNLYAIFGY